MVEDIDNFSRLSLMLTALKTEEGQNTIAGESCCNCHFKHATEQQNDSRSTYRQEDYDKAGYVGVSRRVRFKPILGPVKQAKLFPLRYCPIQIELELVNSLLMLPQ